MSRLHKLLTALAMLGFFGIALVVGLARLEPSRAQNLVITTSTPGGTYILIGEQMARVLEEYPGDVIGRVEAIPSAGTPENIQRLVNGEADVALVSGPILANHSDREDIRALMSLYDNIWHVVVRRSASIESLRDLRGKRVYVGRDESGNNWGATRILQTVGISESDYLRVPGPSLHDAATQLQSGEADAAFFLAGIPVEAVADALGSGCCELLDLQADVESIRASVPSLEFQEISSHTYENQPDPVQSVGTRALLVARKDLRDDVVLELVDGLFDSISELAIPHPRLQDVRFERAFSDLPPGIEFHPGAIEFQTQQRGKLLIATGVIDGRYFELGKRMQQVLEADGIDTRMIHTDGSLENLELLEENLWPAMAILQYDVALASLWSSDIYDSPRLGNTIPQVTGLRRIAALHEESIHVLMRRDRIPPEMVEHPTLAALQNALVCLGPPKSGTQVMAQALLDHHGVVPKTELFLSVPDMEARLHSGAIDAGFFFGHVPSEALNSLVNNDQFRLLSIDPGAVAGHLTSALTISTIEPGTYRAQREGEPAVDTVSTWAVLVTREDLPFNVRQITEALFEGTAFLDIDGGVEIMARDLPSLPLHPAVAEYFRDEGIFPPEPVFDWLTATWRSLAILVMLVAGYQGILKLRRDRTSNEIGRRVFAISLESDEPNSVHNLLEIRDGEIRERVQQRWWRRGELDKSRWRYLHDLINDRIRLAKENLTAALAEDLRELAHEAGSDVAGRHQRLQSLEERVWTYFQKGELDASHQALLMEVIQRNLR
ncbi:MAG: TAXI family TRAP transporter solute-binding subunit [Gemmatimonadales bacterium]